jgi:hypothetical protein
MHRSAGGQRLQRSRPTPITRRWRLLCGMSLLTTMMLRPIRLLFRTFTPVEIAVLDSVVAALPAAAAATCKEQVASITKVQRHLEWTEINFYRITHGRPDWTGVPLFPDRGEFALSQSKYTIDGHRFTTRIMCVAGHIFSFVTRPSIKKYCFGSLNDIQTIVFTDPTQGHTERTVNLPRTFTDWHAMHQPERNGWSVLPFAETYTVHLADADYMVLAARGGEFLLSQIGDETETIYYASTTCSARSVGQSLVEAMAAQEPG